MSGKLNIPHPNLRRIQRAERGEEKAKFECSRVKSYRSAAAAACGWDQREDGGGDDDDDEGEEELSICSFPERVLYKSGSAAHITTACIRDVGSCPNKGSCLVCPFEMRLMSFSSRSSSEAGYVLSRAGAYFEQCQLKKKRKEKKSNQVPFSFRI